MQQQCRAQGPAQSGPSVMNRSISHARHPSTRVSRACKTKASVTDWGFLKPLTSLGKISNLKEGIATFYDNSSGLWEDMWGEHMHHGYYPRGGRVPASHQQAQIDLVDETLKWAGVTNVTSIVDVGCGIGGSSRHVLRKWAGAKAQGITLSPRQAARAQELSAQAGLGDRAHFQVADALAQPFPDASFDLVWSMESGEHMPDKRRFVGELCRVCMPGGRIIIVTWCHRELGPSEPSLTPGELSFLQRINEAYYLPDWVSASTYATLLKEEGMTDVRVADWSDDVTPFWGAVIQTALTAQGMKALLKAGWTTIKGALVMPLMAQGYNMGLIKFMLITAAKPTTADPANN